MPNMVASEGLQRLPLHRARSEDWPRQTGRKGSKVGTPVLLTSDLTAFAKLMLVGRRRSWQAAPSDVWGRAVFRASSGAAASTGWPLESYRPRHCASRVTVNSPSR